MRVLLCKKSDHQTVLLCNHGQISRLLLRGFSGGLEKCLLQFRLQFLSSCLRTPMGLGSGRTTNPRRRTNPSRPIRVRRRATNPGRPKRVRPRQNQKRSGIVRPNVRPDAWSDQVFHLLKFDRDDAVGALHRRQRDGAIAGILVEPLAPALALFLDRVERWRVRPTLERQHPDEHGNVRGVINCNVAGLNGGGAHHQRQHDG